MRTVTKQEPVVRNGTATDHPPPLHASKTPARSRPPGGYPKPTHTPVTSTPTAARALPDAMTKERSQRGGDRGIPP